MTRTINAAGLALVKECEGLRLEAYDDGTGTPTIGWGHTDGVEFGQTVTEAEAEALLRQDLARFEAGVAQLVRVPINENEFAALVSLAFNIGLGGLAGSTVLRRLNAEDRTGAADAFLLWNKARIGAGGELVVSRGLARRRAAEKALFLTWAPSPVPTAIESTRARPVEDPPRREKLRESRTLQGAGLAGGATAVMGAEQALGTAERLRGATERGEGLFAWASAHLTEIALLVALGALAWIVYARVDDWRKERR